MSTIVNLTVSKTGYVRGDNPDTHYPTSSSGSYLLQKQGREDEYPKYYRLYFGFPTLDAQYKYNVIEKVQAYVCIKGSSTGDNDFFLYSAADFNLGTITYNTKPSRAVYEDSESIYSSSWTNKTFDVFSSDYIDFLKNKAFFLSATYEEWANAAPYGRTVLADGSSSPYVKVTLGDKIFLRASYKAGPKDGAYSDPRKSIKFQWKNTASDSVSKCYNGSISQTSAIFYWKTSSANSWNTVNVSGTSTSVTISANTFPTASTIQWYVKVTDAGGTSRSTSTFSFSTTAATMFATPVSPKGSVEENNAPITLRWSLSSADGFPASSVKLWWKLHSDSNWTDLYVVNQAITSYTVPANTFPTGEIDWYVRAWNVDNVEGTGNGATFVSYGAPNAPIVDSDQAPFVTLYWQSSDQEAYDIEIAGKHYGPYFGTDKTFTLPDYLEDGTYLARVRVLGQYGLWSQWGEITLYIANVPSEPINLTAKTFIDAELSWTTEELTSDFLIYRNGKQIGHTTGNTFTDRLSNGETEYYVVNRLADGNYSKSEVLQRTINLDNTYLALLDGGDWFVAKYTSSVAGSLSVSDTTDASFLKISGKTYPAAVVSEFRTTMISMTTAFLNTQKDERNKFLSLQGKPVIAKFKDGRSGVYMITSLRDQRSTPFYVEYSFTMQQIDWEDYIDE